MVSASMPVPLRIGTRVTAKKMALPMAPELISLIKMTGKGCYLYSCDISRAYRKLPLDPCDWPLVCLKVQG